MAEYNGNANGNGSADSLCAVLDPDSHMLSQFSDGHKAQILKETAGTSTMERGPRYNEYSNLRDKRLRMKQLIIQQTPEKQRDQTLQIRKVLTSQKKQMKFNSQESPSFATPPKRPNGSSVLTKSVPDFSYVLRKENRRPVLALPPVVESSATPTTWLSKSGKIYSKMGGGSTPPTNSGEKRGGGLIGRKSYANFDELKGLTVAASNMISRKTVTRRSVSGYRML
ncbi:hypothetical protein F511_13328 [Dorcoceras hygrometricum]|uniref:Uncharacterized protein n=1 Tax=Dorcoceras hygrometricum TaxID=472368 RepID=A0A2Z7A5W4_9LAMI|nr:hypothetical protein F511_43529 [Dorcoceras hygrometricum]KZV42229.1 hypothetical protein F511_13328 [Dorcoceras hygrometricum]